MSNMNSTDHRISVAISRQLFAACTKLKNVQFEIVDPKILENCSPDRIIKLQAIDAIIQDIDALAKCLSDWARNPNSDPDNLFASVTPVELSNRLRDLPSKPIDTHDGVLF